MLLIFESLITFDKLLSEKSGNRFNVLHWKNIIFVLVIRLMSIFEIPFKKSNFSHPQNQSVTTFFVFQFEISGNFLNNLHPQNILLIFLTFLISHFERSGKLSKFSQLQNISFIYITFSVLNFEIPEILINDSHP